jgi:hypothetical protein
MAAFLPVIGHPLLNEPIPPNIRRLMAYLFCMRKIFVTLVGIGVLSPTFDRHHADSAIFMPCSCMHSGLPRYHEPPTACTHPGTYGILAVCTPQQGEETWRQLALEGNAIGRAANRQLGVLAAQAPFQAQREGRCGQGGRGLGERADRRYGYARPAPYPQTLAEIAVGVALRLSQVNAPAQQQVGVVIGG